ncbi:MULTISPECIES: Cfr family 23S rRNA (adenine(2503)-C(8))-methyltransferase [Bacillus]|uniref:Cfr family 23S rRNA (adenine(2503)-C(8))-methyltransferase n=1 Tax=Bacillus TaxID=1386 RepID=UPI00026BA423|nr:MULTISPECIES: Cfr family 23S rRNA (adenine(2503)-C(8))-methyltransferase [Bacillus]AIW28857.1 chloramphenicol/florfenicol resistance protein [Bacillus subtilis]MBL3611903.1 Cfr family 23S rRNA (adenine(2503)-C(8))-methyltransferase [Bacillus sp. RHFS18]AJK64297.1 chloramphenicol/florfenicol resistance protein [Bacillus amyloliquefaciens KHG19]AKL75157.1 chloramphenicol/florfenicol resistance protein [Bacillus velezensis]ATL38486.1 Cfr family 23S ribosomal RNA methyltransferase [Bacillus vel
MQQKNKYIRIQEFLKQNKFPDFRMNQIKNAVFQGRINHFNEITVLPKSLRKLLIEEFGESILNIAPLKVQHSEQVTKVLFEISGDEKIETVNMKYKAGWESFCISSQCGCHFGCKFCATGDIGLKRNLTSDEMTDQILYFHLKGHSIDSISFMGMGEALANVQVFDALHVLTNPKLFALSPRRLSISTIGIIPGIKKITQDYPQVNLTFSLHSPFNEQRSKLMPINERYPLLEVMDTLDEHIRVTSRKVYIAYIMLPGVNDSIDHANEVVNLLRSRYKRGNLFHVNIIRYNPTVSSPMRFEEVNEKQVVNFYKKLKSAGINVTVRSQFGIDIDAACGQLYGNYQKNKNQ